MGQFLSHPVPAVVVLLGLLVFFHELGHFLVGRLCGIAVETFSIGFGPRIFGFTHRGTDYRISWIPLGGYVKFAGSHPSEEVPPGLEGKAFLKTSLAKRAATVLAGPLANFVLAMLVYTSLGMSGIPHPPPLIGEVVEGSAAATAGIKYGDKIVKIDTRKVTTWRDIEEVISTSPGKQLAVTVERDGHEEHLTLTPDAVKTTDMLGKPVTIGRAGIALGRPPSIVSVLDKSAPAGQAGVATGDQISEIAFGGQSYAVAYYPELVARFRQALAAPQVDAVTLNGKLTVRLPNADARSAILAQGDRQLMAALGLGNAELTIGPVEDAAAADGFISPLVKGDVLLAWNDQPLTDVFALREKLISNSSPSVTLKVLRGQETHEVMMPLKGVDAQRPDGTVTIYTLPVTFWGQAVEPDPVIERYPNPVAALGYGIRQTAIQTRELISNVASLISGEVPLKAVGGPMLIAKVAGDSARRGWQTFLGSMALISVNLGLINLFPIPVLDGGQLVLMGAEAVRRRPLREAAIENFQKLGFAMILALVVLATYNDLSRFWRSMLESVVGLFQ